MARSILVVTPAHRCDPGLAIAACRAGEIGLLDLGPDGAHEVCAQAIARLAERARTDAWGVRWDAAGPWAAERLERPGAAARFPLLLLAGIEGPDTPDFETRLALARRLAVRVLIEVYTAETALLVAAKAPDGVVVKALEAGGRVSAHSAFLLLQQLRGRIACPWWIQGAWGPDTAAAAYLAGATGIVLGEELWLARDSGLPDDERRQLEALDGSESLVLDDGRASFRLFSQRGREALAELRRRADLGLEWRSLLDARWRRGIGAGEDDLLALGQGIAFSARLSRHHVSTGGVLEAFRRTVAHHLEVLPGQRAFAPGARLAAGHGTRYPLLQGPMTRVSDVVPFAEAVARQGALPFIALALMRGDEARALLERTREALAEQPWGVGILGFVPPELRREQLEALSAVKPRFAIVAGGRPSQAIELEATGIATYLHVPSPGLLASFIEQGARRFILEGRECGGHVGPRSSFVLWQSAIDVLLDARLADPESLHVVFAGGIHDAFSAALVQALAAPLVEQGVAIGMLLGTAYLFTHEALSTGAITAAYQEEAVACRETVLLQSGLGHATRCARTAFVDQFERLRRELLAARRPDDEIRFELEMLNVGRLRLASKGLTRLVEQGSDAPGTEGRAELLARGAELLKGRLVPVDAETQRRDGMYMIGEVATLRERTLAMAELHEDVSVRGTEQAAQLARRELPWHDAVRPAGAAREPLAVIGMACRFPRAADLASYWNNILQGVDAVREVPHERWDPARYYDAKRGTEDRLDSKWGAFLEACRFDPLRHGIPPATASSIEPIQLLALDVAADALDDAGYAERPFPRDRTAVIFAAGGVNDVGMAYAMRTMLPQFLDRVEGLDEQLKRRIIDDVRRSLPRWTEDSFPGFLQNVVSGRVANRLDLQGTNFVVDAACAASLAALQTAADQLRSRACDVALVGGADATNNAFMFMSFSKTHALTPSGRIRPFDERADGIVLGEGVAAVVLKRLADAERDGDRIHAVIRGIGSSSDGRNRSLTAPHTAAQTLALERAFADAGVPPTSVALIEAHATGTAVGDRSELAAMQPLFATAERSEPYCAVGSVKSMIGHTKTVAGMAGLIKTVLALEHRVLPRTLHVETPSRQVDLEHGPFYVNTASRPWIRHEPHAPRRAGVSAFGFGGTNFHVVLEEHTDRAGGGLSARDAEILCWSRADRGALAREIERLAASLAGVGTFDLGQLARSVHWVEGRRGNAAGPGGVRAALVVTAADDLRAKLQRLVACLGTPSAVLDEPDLQLSDGSPASPSEVCFLFPGQGSQYPNMLEALVRDWPGGIESVEHADELLADLLPRRLSDYLFPRPAFDKERRREIKAALDDTRIAQPALGFASAFASKLLGAFGLEPAFAAGHSYGEHVALAAMGLITHDDLLRSSAIRGRAVHEAGRDGAGAMAAVAAGEDETREALERLGIPAAIANVNAPRQVVIAGPRPVIEAALSTLPAHGLATRRVAVTAAFHTAAMEGPSSTFADYLRQLAMQPPRVPVYSNVTSGPYPRELEAIRAQMAQHLARPVRFVDQIRALHRDGARLFFEVGPGRILTGFVRRILEGRPHVALAMDEPGLSAWVPLARLLACAHTRGLAVDLAPWFAGRRLAARTPAEYLDDLRRREAGRPTDWIVDSRGARQATPSPAPELPAAERREEADQPMPRELEQPAPTPPTQTVAQELGRLKDADATLLTQLNEAMRKWLELQEQQHRLSERFLAIQERIVNGLFGGAGAREASAGPLLADDAGLDVVPAPLLPDLRPVGEGARQEGPPIDVAPREGTEDEPAPGVAPRTEVEAEGELGVERFTAELLAEISRRTGYPQDMLELDAQLEAGLGIDSIKTMEIFGALKRYHPVLSGAGEMDEDSLVLLTQMKTLREIIDYYGGRLAERGVPSAVVEQSAARGPSAADCSPLVERLVLRPVPAPRTERSPTGGSPPFPRDHVLLMLGEPPDLAASIEAALDASGFRVVRVLPGRGFRELGPHRFEVDLSDRPALERLADWIHTEARARVGGLISLLGLGEPMSRPGINGAEAPLRLVQWLTQVAQTFESDIRASAPHGGGWLINVTSLDGRFGLSRRGDLPLAQAGSLGFFKSLAHEWRGLQVRNLDLDPARDPQSQALALLQELVERDGPLEIGLDAEGRWRLELVEAPRTTEGAADSTAPALDSASVVLATGGGDGITAEIVKRLAEKTRCRLVIVGRTALDATDESWPAEESALRATLIEHARRASAPLPVAAIERRVQEVLKRRRITENLAALRAAGSDVEYHALDVRDGDAFGALIDSIYERYGRLDGVLHGAGVIEDCFLRDKTPESLARVFETKVKGAHALARRLRPESLRFLVFFSSLSGRFGNAGQCDYSAANEYLNKLASQLDREWPARVVAINWGPWNSGMVPEALRAAYAERGIGLISVEEGTRSMLAELERGAESDAEVVLSCTPHRIARLAEPRA